ncbi:MAG: hypothetical protein ACRENE_28995 [Polyangiaceae bacterium]
MHRTGAWVTLFLAAMTAGSAIASCNSSTTTSTGTGPLTGGGFGGGVGGSASGGFGGSQCTSAAACLPGQACCGQIGMPFASCQTAPCPADQFCSNTAECLRPGYECRAAAPNVSVSACLPPAEAGTDSDGSPDDASDERAPGDGSSTDGPPRGDGAGDGGDSGAPDGGAD